MCTRIIRTNETCGEDRIFLCAARLMKVIEKRCGAKSLFQKTVDRIIVRKKKNIDECFADQPFRWVLYKDNVDAVGFVIHRYLFGTVRPQGLDLWQMRGASKAEIGHEIVFSRYCRYFSHVLQRNKGCHQSFKRNQIRWIDSGLGRSASLAATGAFYSKWFCWYCIFRRGRRNLGRIIGVYCQQRRYWWRT